jgi:hypothetical protein
MQACVHKCTLLLSTLHHMLLASYIRSRLTAVVNARLLSYTVVLQTVHIGASVADLGQPQRNSSNGHA